MPLKPLKRRKESNDSVQRATVPIRGRVDSSSLNLIDFLGRATQKVQAFTHFIWQDDQHIRGEYKYSSAYFTDNWTRALRTHYTVTQTSG